MPKEDSIEIMGDVTVSLPNGKFTVELENGVEITAHPSGKIRMNKILIKAFSFSFLLSLSWTS